MDFSDQSGPPQSSQYKEGIEAYNANNLQNSNPYADDSREHEDWDAGWCDSEGYEHWVLYGD